MERRKTPRKDWVISKDEVGRAVLEWKLDPLRAKRMEEADPLARTYDFLERLEVPDLALEEDAAKRASQREFKPYDSEVPPGRRKRSP